MRKFYGVFKTMKIPEKLRLFFSKLSLTKKLILANVLILLLPIVVIGFFAFQNIRSNIQRDEINNSMLILQQLKNNINKNIETCEIAAQSIINNRDILDFANHYGTMGMDEVVDFKFNKLTNIESVMHANPSIHVIRFFLENIGDGEIPPIIMDESSLKIEQSWKRRILELNGNTFWGINASEENSICLFREIEYPVGEHVGIFQISMLPNVFFNGVYDAPGDRNSLMCTINGNNILIDTNNAFYRKLKLDKGRLLNDLPGRIKAADGYFYIDAHDIEVAVTYTYVGKIDSYLFRLSSISATAKKLNRTRLAILLCVVGTFLVLTFVTDVITSILLKKLKIVIGLMRKIGKGQMLIDIPDLGSDEIGELATHFRNMLGKINELTSTVLRKQAVTKDAEIRALHSQINAHFIYNALESIKMMAFVKYQYEISEAITLLGRLMRYNIDWKNKYVLLEEEINHIKNYIKLINIRHNNKVALMIDIEDRFKQYRLLKMLLQPVVENAVNHGLEPKGTSGAINIKAYSREGSINLVVTDNGAGMSAEKIQALRKKLADGGGNHEPEPPKSNGIGLENVNERIKLYYGAEYGLDIRSEENVFTEVTVRLPYNDREPMEDA